MPVPTSLDDLSTNPAENSPLGTESVFPNLDDYMRTGFAFIAQVRQGPILLTAIPEDFITLEKLAAAVQHGIAQPGDFKWKFGTTADDGWLILDGDEVSRAAYAPLWAYAQASGLSAESEDDKEDGQFGPGNGTTTFTLPNVLGDHIRAWDKGRGIDTGREPGTLQLSQNLAHTHEASSGSAGDHSHTIGVAPSSNPNVNGGPQNTSRPRDGSSSTSSGGAHTHPITINSSGGSEVRVRNVALLPLIFAGV